MSPRDKILILGASSYVGRPLFDRLGPQRAAATYHQRPLDAAVRFDSLSMDLAEVVKDPSSFSHAVILFADKNPESCAADPAGSRALNVESVCRVLDRLRQWGVTPIFASTEFVFDGSEGRRRETDAIRPVLVYGRQKAEVERRIQESFGRHLILRLGKVFGRQRGDGTLFTKWLDAIERGETIRLATDQIFSPVYIDDVIEAVVRLIDLDLSGIYHVAGGQTASRPEFLEMLLEELRRRGPFEPKVARCSLHGLGLNELWPLDVSLDSRKLVAETGLRLTDVRRVCRDLAADLPEGLTQRR